MRYYAVWVRSLGYRGHEPLIYASAIGLTPGAIVQVSLQRESVLGFVERAVPRPSFATKPIAHVYDLSPLPPGLLRLAIWLRDYYATSLGAVTTLILPADLNRKALASSVTDVVDKRTKVKLAPLNVEQTGVVKNITNPDTYLLHGRTGSGKTRVYIELAERTVAAGQSTIILTPEIGLTSQLAESLQQVFGSQVVVLHSQLTPAARRLTWLNILRSTKPLVVVGPRSALFSPIDKIGLIVLDEAHEPAYKQEQAPYYHARTVASELARIHSASLVIGSATPSVTDYFLATERHKPILVMNQLAKPGAKPATRFEVVDLKDHTQFTRSRQLSRPLLDAIKGAVNRGEQSLLYLNRRGTARVVLCENCGWQALCPHCDLPLIYHADSGNFRCHTCGYSQAMVLNCPACGHPSVLFKTFGTKAVAEEVARLFPGARVRRFDTDNRKSDRLESQYQAVKAGDVDILVGTQLLAKGLDLPRLSTVGIVQADTSLSVPDYSAQERTYQLISQALGRVGRGHGAGYAVVQTYHPDSPLLQAAIKQDYVSFYDREIKERRAFHFPPFSYLLKLSTRRASYKAADRAAEALKTAIIDKISGVTIDGPTPSFHEKLQGKYQLQLVVRSPERSRLLAVIPMLPSGWSYDIDPIDLL